MEKSITKKEIELIERAILLIFDMKSHQADKNWNGYKEGVKDLAKILKELCG